MVMNTESISFSCKLWVGVQISPAFHITQESFYRVSYCQYAGTKVKTVYKRNLISAVCGTDREVMDIANWRLWKWTQTTGDVDQSEGQQQRSSLDFLRTPPPHHTFLYITIIKKEETLLIKSINHTGGVGSSVHPLVRVSNQSSSLVMYSWEM